MQRILITGASGCIGHYVTEALIQQTNHELVLLVRNPQKLQLDVTARPGITVLQRDLRDLDTWSEVLPTVTRAVLTATAWGDPKVVFDVNVTQTVELVRRLHPQVCQQVLYFSTASILDRHLAPLAAAKELGTDYIRSKYLCMEQLATLEAAPTIVKLFPTLVFGGDRHKPYSFLSADFPKLLHWVDFIRWFKAEGSFHFIHAQDIAQVVVHLIEHPETTPADNLVLGNPEITVNECIRTLCTFSQRRIYGQVDVSPLLANTIVKIFNIQMADWDRFCLQYRYFGYDRPVSPATFGLACSYPTLTDLLKGAVDQVARR